jgi:hypothetical protein
VKAITALKKGAQLLKYGRRGKPKFCPFRLSNDESVLIWYSGREEKKLWLNTVTRIVPGQRTAVFQRYPRPEKEYQSFSLIQDNDCSLDVICKDKEEAEVWFFGLEALISGSQMWKSRSDGKIERISDASSPIASTQKSSPLTSPFGSSDRLHQVCFFTEYNHVNMLHDKCNHGTAEHNLSDLSVFFHLFLVKLWSIRYCCTSTGSCASK